MFYIEKKDCSVIKYKNFVGKKKDIKLFIYITILYNTEYINSYIYHGIQIKSVCKSQEKVILICSIFCETIIIDYKKSLLDNKGNLYIIEKKKVTHLTKRHIIKNSN